MSFYPPYPRISVFSALDPHTRFNHGSFSVVRSPKKEQLRCCLACKANQVWGCAAQPFSFLVRYQNALLCSPNIHNSTSSTISRISTVQFTMAIDPQSSLNSPSTKPTINTPGISNDKEPYYLVQLTPYATIILVLGLFTQYLVVGFRLGWAYGIYVSQKCRLYLPRALNLKTAPYLQCRLLCCRLVLRAQYIPRQKRRRAKCRSRE